MRDTGCCPCKKITKVSETPIKHTKRELFVKEFDLSQTTIHMQDSDQSNEYLVHEEDDVVCSEVEVGFSSRSSFDKYCQCDYPELRRLRR